MKTKLLSFIALFSTLLAFTSCLKGNDDEGTTYDDSAITAFSLGTLKYTKHAKTKAGADTIIHTTLNASSYKFYIDQMNREIYNVDSLPYGVDVRKALCTIAAKNGGSVVLKSMTSDSLKFYVTTDSLDFSKPRTLIVYSQSGKYNRSYTVKVNVHKTQVGRFVWQSTTGQDSRLGTLSAMKAVAMNGKVYVMGTENGTTKLYVTSSNQIQSWQQLSPDKTLDAQASSNLIAFDGFLYTCSGGQILRSQDGQSWETRGHVALKQLIGGVNGVLYGVGNSGMMKSEDGGTSWSIDTTNGDLSELPSQNIHLFSFASKVNAGVYNLVMVGNAPTTNDVLGAKVWGKQIDPNQPAQPWRFYGLDEPAYVAPGLTHLQIVSVGDDLIALGGKGLGNYQAKAFESFFVSEGQGLGWKKDDRITLPEGFESSETSFAMVVDEHQDLWLIAGGSGKIWKGNLAGLILKK